MIASMPVPGLYCLFGPDRGIRRITYLIGPCNRVLLGIHGAGALHKNTIAIRLLLGDGNNVVAHRGHYRVPENTAPEGWRYSYVRCTCGAADGIQVSQRGGRQCSRPYANELGLG